MTTLFFSWLGRRAPQRHEKPGKRAKPPNEGQNGVLKIGNLACKNATRNLVACINWVVCNRQFWIAIESSVITPRHVSSHPLFERFLFALIVKRFIIIFFFKTFFIPVIWLLFDVTMRLRVLLCIVADHIRAGQCTCKVLAHALFREVQHTFWIFWNDNAFEKLSDRSTHTTFHSHID